MKIGNIGKLISGQVTTRIEAKMENEIIGKIKILLPKAIKNGKINHQYLSEINVKAKFNENKLTRKGDIVIKLSPPFDAAYITEKDEGILITSFFLVLREIDININPRYLIEVINSEIYKKQALMLISGASAPMLTKSKIECIDLILNLERQEEIIKISKEIKQKEDIFNEIIKLEKLKFENILKGEN